MKLLVPVTLAKGLSQFTDLFGEPCNVGRDSPLPVSLTVGPIHQVLKFLQVHRARVDPGVNATPRERLTCPCHGTWRSLAARSVRDAEVAGSNPAVPTRETPGQGPPSGVASGLGVVPVARPSRASGDRRGHRSSGGAVWQAVRNRTENRTRARLVLGGCIGLVPAPCPWLAFADPYGAK